MGKWTDKDYITHSEWVNEFGGAKKQKSDAEYQRLPFDYCALTMQPFRHPVCSPEGHVFDLAAILPYLQKYGKNPITGFPLSPASLVRLHYTRAPDSNELRCPVTLRTFTDSSHIVANGRTGHVYLMEAVERLKWKDFFTDEPFKRSDLIVLQDPLNVRKRTTAASNIHTTEESNEMVVAATPSLFSTCMPLRPPSEEEWLFSRVTANATVAIQTTLGDLVFELFCAKVPRTCYNFIQLAKKGYYRNLSFHRLVPEFIVQTGDPTGTGSGGQSCWGRPFDNEFGQGLAHNARGILSMANRGVPRSNTSQFFIAFSAQPILDRIHPVFGKLVRGAAVLDQIEAVPAVDSRPCFQIIMEDVYVLDDPFERLMQQKTCAESKTKKPKVDPYVLVKKARSRLNTPDTIGRYMKK